VTPLEDPAYEPLHPPVDGQLPDVVRRFGKATQLRWFARFGDRLAPRTDWDEYWCQSEHHKGPCCGPCEGEFEDGYQGGGVMMDGWCCCKDGRASWRRK
jgi:hypothetical protein